MYPPDKLTPTQRQFHHFLWSLSKQVQLSELGLIDIAKYWVQSTPKAKNYKSFTKNNNKNKTDQLLDKMVRHGIINNKQELKLLKEPVIIQKDTLKNDLRKALKLIKKSQ